MLGLDRRVLLVALTAVLVHAGSLRGEFLEWDDALLVSDNRVVIEGGLSDLGDLLNPFGDRAGYGFEYLPLRDLSNRVDRLFWGMDPVGYHLGNVLLFGVAAAALYGILLTLLRDRRAALLGALLYAVHPAATESVACIAHRKDVLMAAFALLAWLTWLRERRVLASILLAAAVLSKLPAVALPPLVLLTDLARRRRFDLSRFAFLGLLFAIAGGATAVSVEISPALGGATWHGGTPATNALSVGVAFLETVRLLLVPIGLHVGRVNETMTRTEPDAASLAGLLLLVGLLATGLVAFVRQRRHRRPSMGGLVLVLATLGFLALQAPYLQIRPFWVLFAERYFILALVPLSLAAGFLIARWRGRWPTVAFVGVLVLLAVLTWNREKAWKDTETLFTDAYEKEPRSYIALDKVGRLKYLGGDLAAGRALFRRSIDAAEALRPRGQALLEQILVTSRQDLINTTLGLGRNDEARIEAEIWVEGWPDSYLARAFLGLVAHRSRRPDEAEAHYHESIRMARDQGTTISMSHHNLGILYRDRDGPGTDRSMGEFERAVAADRHFVAAWEELARGHGANGRWEAVADAFRNALRVQPDNPKYLQELLAVLEQRLGRFKEAQDLRREALRRR